MYSTSTVLPLFGEDATRATAAPRPAAVNLGMTAPVARLVAYRDTQHEDGQPRALLVVDCPFCEHQHVHPAGLASAPRVCPRTSRCVNRPTGVYYFPAVQRDR